MGPDARDGADRRVIQAQRLVDIDMSGLRLSSFCAIASRFERCSFRGATIDAVSLGAGRRQSLYVGCCFDDTHFADVFTGNSRFVRCSFRDIHIGLLRSHDAEFVDCTFTGRIDSGYLEGTRDPATLPMLERLFSRRTNEIAGNDFSACELRDFSFRTGVDLGRQKLPAGPQYLFLRDAAAAIRIGRAAIASWRDDETRRLATILLEMMEGDLTKGQRSQFLCIPEYGDFAEAWRELRMVITAPS